MSFRYVRQGVARFSPSELFMQVTVQVDPDTSIRAWGYSLTLLIVLVLETNHICDSSGVTLSLVFVFKGDWLTTHIG